MNINAKLLFFISSYSPLLLILIINSKFNFEKVYNGNITLSSVFVISSIFLIVISILFLIWVIQDRNINKRKINISKIENKTSEIYSYILPYIVAFYQVDFSKDTNIIIFVIIFITIFAVYVNSNLMAINPVLAILGYKVFVIDTEKSQKVFLISKKEIFLNEKIVWAVPVCCNIYLAKE